MSAYQDFLNTQFGDDKPISQRLAREVHRIGTLGDSKAEKLLKAILPAIAELEGAELRAERAAQPPGPRVVMSEKPSEISRTIINASEFIDFPRLADVTSAAVHDLRLSLTQGCTSHSRDSCVRKLVGVADRPPRARDREAHQRADQRPAHRIGSRWPTTTTSQPTKP